MDFAIRKRTGFRVDFACLSASKTRAKDKEVPIHVYEHTLSRLGSAMPVACVHPTVVSDAHRSVAWLGDVSEQANGVWGVPNDPSRYASFAATTAPVRPILQFLQPVRLDRARLGPSARRGGSGPTQPARTVVSGRRRHADDLENSLNLAA